MSNEHDMVLKGLFTEADRSLEDSAFTQKVIRRTYRMFLWLGLLAVGTMLVGLVSLWVLDLSPLALVQRLTELITTPVFKLSNEWAAWAMAPVNNIAGALILGFKGYRVLHKKVLRGSSFR